MKKLKFEEAISVPVSERISVAESIDFHTIGISPSYLLIFLLLYRMQFVMTNVFHSVVVALD